MLNRAKKLKPFKRNLFVIVIGLSVIMFWKGAWDLIDLYIFPNNPILNAWTSFLIGLIILWTTHYLTRELA